VSKDFFVQFGQKTWLSPYSVVSELVEDSFDEDSTRVTVTVGGDYVVVEDDAGMDQQGVERFLTVGSIHKQFEPFSPKFRRARTGRFGVGRMSFLGFFNAMKVRTRKGKFSTTFLIDEECIAGLAQGEANVKVLDEPPLERYGSEIWLLDPKSVINPKRILENLRELLILREPFFEVWLRAGSFTPQSLENAERLKPREIMGERVPVKLDDGVTGEITIAYRPLMEKERGILVLQGSHIVTRSNFGLSPSELSRISGWVRCDWITTRFADKAAVIEDEAYERLQKRVRKFLVENVLLRAIQAERGMTYEESRVFMEIDRLLSRIVKVEAQPAAPALPAESAPQPAPPQPVVQPAEAIGVEAPKPSEAPAAPQVQVSPSVTEVHVEPASEEAQPTLPPTFQPVKPEAPSGLASQKLTVEAPKLKVSKPKPLRREIALSKLGFRAVPYDDESDDREFFVEEHTIYVNKAHLAYRKELKRGHEVLRRHVLRIVASALAAIEHPETEALEYANKLIAEALKHF
jgi:hypothetical protein